MYLARWICFSDYHTYNHNVLRCNSNLFNFLHLFAVSGDFFWCLHGLDGTLKHLTLHWRRPIDGHGLLQVLVKGCLIDITMHEVGRGLKQGHADRVGNWVVHGCCGCGAKWETLGHFGTLASTAELQLTFQDTDLPNGPDKAICNQMPASGHFSTVCFMVYKPPRNKSRAS